MILDSRDRGGLRMFSDEFTLEGLKKRLLVDTSAREDPEEVCAIYALCFKQFSPGFGMWDPAEYAKLGDKGCAEYSPDSFMDIK